MLIIPEAWILTWTMKMIAATIGGPIITEMQIPFNMSLKNKANVCCTTDVKDGKYQKLRIL